MKKPQSSVSCSIIAPLHVSALGSESATSAGSVILPATLDRMEFGAQRFQRDLERTEHALRLGLVIGQQIAHVDIDGHEAEFGPGMDGEMRFSEQHRAGDALRLELVEAIADNGKTRVFDGLDAK